MLVFLTRIDAAPVSNDEFSFEFNSWVSVLVDTMNETLRQIQDGLNGQGLTTPITRKTSVEIVALIDRNAVPVLETGLWVDTTIGKLKFLVTPAVAGISDGVTETVTSV